MAFPFDMFRPEPRDHRKRRHRHVREKHVNQHHPHGTGGDHVRHVSHEPVKHRPQVTRGKR